MHPHPAKNTGSRRTSKSLMKAGPGGGNGTTSWVFNVGTPPPASTPHRTPMQGDIYRPTPPRRHTQATPHPRRFLRSFFSNLHHPHLSHTFLYSPQEPGAKDSPGTRRTSPGQIFMRKQIQDFKRFQNLISCMNRQNEHARRRTIPRAALLQVGRTPKHPDPHGASRCAQDRPPGSGRAQAVGVGLRTRVRRLRTGPHELPMCTSALRHRGRNPNH
jgi:hypothetical protein